MKQLLIWKPSIECWNWPERCLNFRSIAKWFRCWKSQPLVRPPQASGANTRKTPLYVRTAFIQNDLSIKVTSCKGRGSCCYFSYFSCRSNTRKRSQQISCPAPMNVVWLVFSLTSFVGVLTLRSSRLEDISACTNTRDFLGSIRNIFLSLKRSKIHSTTKLVSFLADE